MDGNDHGNKNVVMKMFSKQMILDSEEALNIKKV